MNVPDDLPMRLVNALQSFNDVEDLLHAVLSVPSRFRSVAKLPTGTPAMAASTRTRGPNRSSSCSSGSCRRAALAGCSCSASTARFPSRSATGG